MKNKKQIIILASGIFLMVIVITFILASSRKNILENEHINKNSINNKILSIMVETKRGSGEYESYNGSKWPSRYEFNDSLSKCENGGTITWDEVKQKVIMKTNISDKCYAYFDAPPADVEMTITNQPTTVGALANLSCSDATATYNQKYNRIEISEINNKRTVCNLMFSQRTSKTYLNNKIISLVGTTQGTGQVVSENGYRYEGKNPNNYVWFNNELWRIIGVFDSNTHGVNSTNLTKIIRANPIGGLVWDKLYTNDWSNSSLYKLLNPVSGDNDSGIYYNKKQGNGSAYCYSSYDWTSPGNCDYSNIGIDLNYRNMIKQVTWKVGGYTTRDATAATFYTAERETSTGNDNSYAATKTGYIGLIYPSDYGYSVLANSCARTTNLSSYGTSACMGQSWLAGQGDEWLLTPNSSNKYNIFSLIASGSVFNFLPNVGYIVRPSLYLDASVYVIDGSGTESNPYIIGM